MNTREKRLALIFGGLLIALPIAGGGLQLIKPSSIGLRSNSLARKLREVKAILESKDLWESREKWMAENIPTFSSESEASAKLLERISKLAGDHGVQIESQEFIKIDPNQDSEMGLSFHNHRVELGVEVTGDLQNIVKYIHEIQSPKHFTGIDRLLIESREDSGMKYQLKITQWYQLL